MRQTLVRFSTHVIGDSRGPPLPAMRPTGHLKGNQGLDSVGWAGPVLPWPHERYRGGDDVSQTGGAKTGCPSPA